MFSTRDVWMVIKAAKLSVVEDDKNVEHRMAECQLVIEDLPRALAHELGEDVASHLFTSDGAIRSELANITLDPRVPMQRVSVKQVVDATGATMLSDVEVLSMTFSRQSDEKTGREWIKAVTRARFDLAPKVHREWLAMSFGYGRHFSFDAEQLSFDAASVIAGVATNPDAKAVAGFRKTMGDDASSVELTTVVGGRRVGTRITKNTVESVDRPVRA